MTFEDSVVAKYAAMRSAALVPTRLPAGHPLNLPDEVFRILFQRMIPTEKDCIGRALEKWLSVNQNSVRFLQITGVDIISDTLLARIKDAPDKNLLDFVPAYGHIRTIFPEYRVFVEDHVLDSEAMASVEPDRVVKDVVPANLLRLYTPTAKIVRNPGENYLLLELPCQGQDADKDVRNARAILQQLSRQLREVWVPCWYSPIALEVSDCINREYQLLLTEVRNKLLSSVATRLNDEYQGEMLPA